MRALQNREIESLRQLQRVKWMATGVLVLCLLVMLAARILETHYPALGFVAAFAEAATIGGIADWYAVVALFKRPLNLPIPHTAIVPANQPRIADNLGRFLEDNFLSRDQVGARLRDINFAAEIASWLSDVGRSRHLAKFVAGMLPQALAAVDQRRLLDFAGDRLTTQLAKTDITPLVGNVLQGFTKDGRHQQLLDEVIRALHAFLHDDDTLEVIRHKVQKELPTVLYLFQADNVILRRLVNATTELLGEIKDTPDHPMREEFEEFLHGFLLRMQRSKRFARRVEEIKSHILDRPELGNMADQVWDSLTEFVLQDVAKKDSVLVARLAELLVDIGHNLKSDPDLSDDINSGLVAVLGNVVEAQKGVISDYVADEVRRWDPRQLVSLIEANVGRDLQFIRFNGMLVGGAVGVILYAILKFLLPLLGVA